MYSVYTYLIEELRHGNDVKGWFLTFVTSHLMRSMNAEAVLKHRVRNEQTSGQKKLPSKVLCPKISPPTKEASGCCAAHSLLFVPLFSIRKITSPFPFPTR